MTELPAHVEKAIRETEEKLTAEVREKTGDDELVVEFDRQPFDYRGPDPDDPEAGERWA